jgi:hypothetical protein
VLHQVNPEHGVQWKGRAASFGAFLGVEGLNQINQRLPRHHLLHLGQDLLAFGLLFGGALLLITKTKLFAAHQASPSQR